MRGIVVMLGVAAALALAPGAGSRTQALSWWSTFDATQRLEVGRFAAKNGIDHAICLGTGAQKIAKYGEKKYRSFDCRAGDATFEHERQLTLRVTGATTFVVTWLKPNVCTPAP
jgi:hypothetical protein